MCNLETNLFSFLELQCEIIGFAGKDKSAWTTQIMLPHFKNKISNKLQLFYRKQKVLW